MKRLAALITAATCVVAGAMVLGAGTPAQAQTRPKIYISADLEGVTGMRVVKIQVS